MEISKYNDIVKDFEFWKNLFLEHLKLKSSSQNTLVTYTRVINEFLEFLRVEVESENCLNELKIENINKYTILTFLNFLKNRLNDKSLILYLKTIKSFFKFISENNESGIDLYYKIEKIRIKEPQREIVTFSDKELERIKDALLKSLDKEKSYSKYKNLMCLFFICYTGIRADECLSIRVNELEIDNDLIRIKIRGKGGKERYVYLNIDFVGYIDKLFKLREKEGIKSNFLFATKNNTKTPYNNLLRFNTTFLKKLGIKDKTNLHIYRHTFASNLVAQNVNLETIKELLGHSNITTTSMYYAKTNERAKKEAVLKFQKK